LTICTLQRCVGGHIDNDVIIYENGIVDDTGIKKEKCFVG